MRQLLHGLAIGLIAAGVGLWPIERKRQAPTTWLREADRDFLVMQSDRLR